MTAGDFKSMTRLIKGLGLFEGSCPLSEAIEEGPLLRQDSLKRTVRALRRWMGF